MPLMNVSLLIARSSIAHLVLSIQVLSLIHVISCMGNDMGSPDIPDPSAKYSRAVWIRLPVMDSECLYWRSVMP